MFERKISELKNLKKIREDFVNKVSSLDWRIKKIEDKKNKLENQINITTCPHCRGSGKKSFIDAAGDLDCEDCENCEGFGII